MRMPIVVSDDFILSLQSQKLETFPLSVLRDIVFDFIILRWELRSLAKRSPLSPRVQRTNKYYNCPSCNDALIHLHSGLSHPGDVRAPLIPRYS